MPVDFRNRRCPP